MSSTVVAHVQVPTGKKASDLPCVLIRLRSNRLGLKFTTLTELL